MIEKNPFKKGTVAYLFFKIDKFFNSPKVAITKVIGSDIINIFAIFLVPLQIIFIILKLIVEILYIATIGMIVAMLIS